MSDCGLRRLFLICYCYWIFTTVRADKWYSGSAGFGSVESWFSDKLPCASDLVVFPAQYRAVLPLPSSDITINGFELPTDGALLLSQDATIKLMGTDTACENSGKRAYIKLPKVSKWFDPNSWVNPKMLKQLAAVPDLERVPCNNEPVVITRSVGPIAFDLENTPFLRLGQLSLAGSSISKDYLQQLLRTDIGQLLFRNAEGVRVEYYRDSCGCHKDFNKYIQPVCKSVSCKRPHCLTPIKPYGSCCLICGAVVRIAGLEHCKPQDSNALDKAIKILMSEKGFSDDLDWHVDYFSATDYGHFLQAVIVDRGGVYNERSIAFVKQLLNNKNNTKLLQAPHSLEVEYSGRQYNPNVTWASILLIIFCLVFVSIVALIIFAHYAPNHPYLNRIPHRWRMLLQFRLSPFVFARFDNSGLVGRGGGGVSGVESVQERILGYDAESGEIRERAAFDNPMFGDVNAQKRQNVAVALETTVAKSDAIPSSSTTTQLEESSMEEQELTEIKLESSTDTESEAEIET